MCYYVSYVSVLYGVVIRHNKEERKENNIKEKNEESSHTHAMQFYRIANRACVE